ncbi:hypothetical protein BDAP_002781 [Binucleata daphniae]
MLCFYKTLLYFSSLHCHENRRYQTSRNQGRILQYYPTKYVYRQNKKYRNRKNSAQLYNKNVNKPDDQNKTEQVQKTQSINKDAELSEIFKEINRYRSGKGLSPFTRNKKLDSAASIQSQHMAKIQKLTHAGPSGLETVPERINKVNYNWSAHCENLAQVTKEIKNTVEMWKKSKVHRENLEGKYKEVGLACETGSDGTNYVTMVAASSKT